MPLSAGETSTMGDQDDGAPQLKTKRKRKSGAKVKTGCLTCKVRHKKCDETRPACIRCKEKGFVCEFLTIHAEARTRVLTCPTSYHPSYSRYASFVSPYSSAPSPYALFPMSDQDIQNFDYFRTTCTKEFSNYFDVVLWEKVVLQAACIEPCIRHATMAIGALARCTNSPAQNPSSSNIYSVKEYTTAVRLLNQRLQGPGSNWELAILGSLVFIAIEVLSGNDEGASIHFRAAFNILKEISCIESQRTANLPLLELSRPQMLSLSSMSQAEHSQSMSSSPPYFPPTSSTDLDDLISAFTRLDVQASTFTGIYSTRIVTMPTLPSAFTSLADARRTLNSIMATIQTFLRIHPPEIKPSTSTTSSINQLHHLLSQWSTLLDSLIPHLRPPLAATHAIQPRTTITILQIHHLVNSLTLSTHFPHYQSQSISDLHLAQFHQIIHLAHEITESCHSPSHSANAHSGPCSILDIGIVQPLFFVVRRCQNPALRRRAIDILVKVRRERVHDVQLLVKLSRWILRVEEGGYDDVKRNEIVGPPDRRLRDVTLEFSRKNGREMCVVVARRRGGGGWEEVVHVVV